MTHQDSNGIWVVSPGQMLDRAQRDSNKTKNKIARGEKLAGPFALGSAGQAQHQADLNALMERIKVLEDEAAASRKAAGLTA